MTWSQTWQTEYIVVAGLTGFGLACLVTRFLRDAGARWRRARAYRQQQRHTAISARFLAFHFAEVRATRRDCGCIEVPEHKVVCDIHNPQLWDEFERAAGGDQ